MLGYSQSAQDVAGTQLLSLFLQESDADACRRQGSQQRGYGRGKCDTPHPALSEEPRLPNHGQRARARRAGKGGEGAAS